MTGLAAEAADSATSQTFGPLGCRLGEPDAQRRLQALVDS